MERVGIDLLFNANKSGQTFARLRATFTESINKMKDDFYAFSKTMVTKMGAAMGQIASTIKDRGKSAFDSLMGSMPEINEAFSVMKDTIINNIAQPLRKLIFPILAKIVNFVRDNRATFVKFGSAIANGFRVIFYAIKTLFDVVSNVMKKVFGAFTFSVKSIGNKLVDFLNLVALKIAFIITFIGILIEPVLEGIARLLKWVFEEIAMPVIMKFSDAVKFLAAVFDDPIKAIKEFDTTTQMLAAGGLTLLGAGMLYLAKTAIAAMIPAFISATTAAIGFAAALWANPLTWIVGGVMLLVGGIVLLIKNWDKLSKMFSVDTKKFKNLGNSIKGFFSGMAKETAVAAKQLLKNITETVSKLPSQITTWFGEVKRKIMTSARDLTGKFTNFFNGLFDFKNIFSGLGSAFDSAMATVRNLWNQFVNTVSSIGSSIKMSIENKINEWWSGFKDTPLGKFIAKGVDYLKGGSAGGQGGGMSPEIVPMGGGEGDGGGAPPITQINNYNIDGAQSPEAVARQVSGRVDSDLRTINNRTDIRRGQ